MKMVMKMKVSEDGSVLYVKRNGDVIDDGYIIENMEMDDN
jgi:hypothetical protein